MSSVSSAQRRMAMYASSILLSLSGVVLVGLRWEAAGWALLAITAFSTVLGGKQFAKDILLLCVSLAILGLTPITTDIGIGHMTIMGIALLLAVAIPYIASRYWYGDYLVRFPFHHGRHWYRQEIGYIVVTIVVAYFLLPFFLRDTGSYRYWTVDPGISSITRLFIGTNALGIWDELFFVSTVLGILRRFFPFVWANLIQSVLFTSFLYELGFRGWGWIMIFLFALIQGEVFRRTESLLYVITIHLSLDFVLFLALIHAHHPEWMPIFFA